MKTIYSSIKTALEDFTRNKIRTFLTSLGILIGVSSVVLLIALGLGLKNYIRDQFNSIGTNLIFIAPGKMGMQPGAGMLGGIEFDSEDVSNLKKSKYIQYVAPAFIKTIEITNRGKSEIGSLIGSSEDIVPVLNMEVSEGRLLRKTDISKKNKVVILGSKIAEKIFPNGQKPIGKKIDIEGQSFTVIGIQLSKGGSSIGNDMDTHIYIPYSATYSFNPNKTFFAIYAKSDPEIPMELAKKEIEKTLMRRYDEDDFSVMEQKEILDTVNTIFSMINIVLVCIGAISLVVGGIGIMNIMYVSVVERIKEIGIRRAIGATKNDILVQFITEAVLLSIIGGVGGILFSTIIVFLIHPFFPAAISISSVIIAFTVSSLIGIIFGVFPARKASNLTPVEAIRYE